MTSKILFCGNGCLNGEKNGNGSPPPPQGEGLLSKNDSTFLGVHGSVCMSADKSWRVGQNLLGWE
jgi:hypothetical protein